MLASGWRKLKQKTASSPQTRRSRGNRWRCAYGTKVQWCAAPTSHSFCCYGQTGRCSDTPNPRHPAASALRKPTGDSRDIPLPSVAPGFLALLLRVGVSITMYISKREPTIEELLADPVMLIMLQHSRTTADDVRALLNRARERLTKASAADPIELAAGSALS
jgi:hypothetical protein